MNTRLAAINHLLCLISYVASAPHCLAEVDEDTKSKIKKAWVKRQNSYHSVVVEFDETSTEQVFSGARGSNVNSELLSRSYKHTLKLDGDKYFYGFLCTSDGLTDSELPSTKEAFDGEQWKTVSSAPGGDLSGTIGSKIVENSFKRVILRPLFHYFKPVHLQMGRVNLEDATVVEGGFVGAKKCIILRTSGKHVVDDLWLSPDLDYLPLRFESHVDGKKIINLEIKYKDGASTIQVANWKVDIFNPAGGLRKSSASTVTHLETNKDIPHESFVLDFAPGTRVGDLDQKKRYTYKAESGNEHLYWALLCVIAAVAIVVVFRRSGMKGKE